MKKGKLILGGFALIATIGSAFAFNSPDRNRKFGAGTLFTSAHCSVKIACSRAAGTKRCGADLQTYYTTTAHCTAGTGKIVSTAVFQTAP